MQGGFSFCDVDIYNLGLEYAPELSSTDVYSPASKSVQEQRIESQDGGYFYGVTTNPKDFVLRCYYEMADVRDGIMTAIGQCFKAGRTGRLVFAKRPWCWYTATVVDIDTSRMLNYMNGLITIKLRAYHPFARCDQTVPAASDPFYNDMINNSGMLTDAEKMPTTQLVSGGSDLTQETSFLLYNPGTERTHVAIEIAGDVVDGVSVSNSTTGQTCKFVAMSKAITTDVSKYIVTDAMNGKTVLTNGTTSQLAFLYHDSGFIELEPSYPIIRNISASYTNGSANVSLSTSVTSSEVLHKYIYLAGTWRKITKVNNAQSIKVSPSLSATGTAVTDIVTMNELTVSPVSTMALSRLNFIYTPTFS